MVKSHLKKEGFDIHTEFIKRQQKVYNPIGSTLIATNNEGKLNDDTRVLMGTYTELPKENGGEIRTMTDPFPVQGQPDGLAAIIKKCEAKKTVDCSAFDDPSFKKDCGVCVDIGVNSNNQNHAGGLVMLEDDRAYGDKQNLGNSNRLPTYRPTIGSCPAGRFASTKEQCLRIKNIMACQRGANFDVPGCSQCYADGSYFPIDSVSRQLNGNLTLQGTGNLVIVESGQQPKNIVFSGIGQIETYNLRSLEGSNITFTMKPLVDGGDPPTLTGIFSGNTPTGKFNIDLRRLIKTDSATGRAPRSVKVITVNQIPATTMTTGFGLSTMSLNAVIPFTFIEADTLEGDMCNNGPYVTKASSAEFLQSDPCYKKGSGPGSFNTECLQNVWLSNGCTQKGTGYPKNGATSGKLMMNPDGSQASLADIANTVYEMAVMTATGMRNGQKLELEEWSDASEMCTGRKITSPCDTPTKDTGPLSVDCLKYMWNNDGFKKPFGATYQTSSNAHSKAQVGDMNQFCQRSGTMSPTKEDGGDNTVAIAYWQNQGGVERVRGMMSEIHRIANSDAPDSIKKDAILQCYGPRLADRPKMSSAAADKNVMGDWPGRPCPSYINSAISSQWENIGGALVNVSVGADGTIWGVNSGQAIYRKQNIDAGWEWIPGSLVMVSCGGSQQVLGVNINQDMWKWTDATGWRHIPGKATWCSIGSDGDMWCVNAQAFIYRWVNGGWQQMPGRLTQICCANANNIVGGYGYTPYKWNGGGWDRLPGDGDTHRMVISNSGRMMSQTKGFKVKFFDGSNWTTMDNTPGQMYDNGMCDDYIFGVNTAQQIWALRTPACVSGGGGIKVQSASYGANCNPGLQGNRTKLMGSICNNKNACNYSYDFTQTGGDPAGGCPKTLDIDYTCGNDGPSKRFVVPAEAGFNGRVALQC